MRYTIPAVIFAGGRSTRMGEDKALLPFAGFDSLAHYQYARLEHLFEKVCLSAKSDKFGFQAPLILDTCTVHSPLCGIVSIFEALEAEEVFVLSVDAPFVDAAVIGKIMEARTKEASALIARTQSGIHPLCGLYRRSILPAAKTALKEDRHRLTSLLKETQSLFVPFDEEAPFANLNHPHDYASARERIRGS